MSLIQELKKQSSKFSILSFVFFYILTFFCQTLYASEEDSVLKQYESLRAKYRTLVINDPGISEPGLWIETRGNFEKALLSPEFKNERVYKPRILYLLGRLHEQIYLRKKDSTELINAEKVFKIIVEEFPGDELADDALLALSRLYHREERYVDEKEVLERILKDYPSSNSVVHAETSHSVLKSKGLIKLAEQTDDSLVDSLENEFEEEFKLSDELSNVGSISSLERKFPIVVIDPGHGGIEDGARGPEGVREKDIVLEISKMIQTTFHSQTKVRVHLTREIDMDLPLQDRTKIANDLGADLFVSIHANASPYKTRKGVETYYLDNTDDKSSLRLAERENMSTNISQKSLSFIISDFIQGIKMDDSISAAHLIQSNLVEELRYYYDSIKDLGVKKAPFYVLVGAHMPCVLVEVSFIDHPLEGRRLLTERYRRVVADGVYKGIYSYLSKKGRIE